MGFQVITREDMDRTLRAMLEDVQPVYFLSCTIRFQGYPLPGGFHPEIIGGLCDKETNEVFILSVEKNRYQPWLEDIWFLEHKKGNIPIQVIFEDGSEGLLCPHCGTHLLDEKIKDGIGEYQCQNPRCCKKLWKIE